MNFRATLTIGGKTATGVVVPPEVVDSLGSGKRPAVRVTINGRYTYRSTVAVMGGEYLLPVAAEHREGAGIAAGEEVEIDLVLDTEPRTVTVPVDVQQALDADSAAATAFQRLSYSAQRRLVIGIEGAKAVETRARRIAKTVEDLLAGKVM